MPMANQKGSKQWESPQIEPKQLRTPVYGGKAPSKENIIKSANARGGQRHDMKGQALADVGVLPDSARMKGNEMVGIKNHDYLVKKKLEYGPDVFYNSLPPGMDIEDQEICDIRRMEMKTITSMGYPGDGWADNEQGGERDYGRPGMTNYGGGKST
jgi:hypothetical protein